MRFEYLILLMLLYIAGQNVYNQILLRKLNMRTIRPVAFSYKFVRKMKGNTKMALVYSISAAAPVDADVVERRLSVTVNGENKDIQVFSGSEVSFGELKVEQNDVVSMTLIDVDDVGNVSTPATVEFTATDTLPPSAPGAFGVALVREE